jgi:hypothetical protein
VLLTSARSPLSECGADSTPKSVVSTDHPCAVLTMDSSTDEEDSHLRRPRRG